MINFTSAAMPADSPDAFRMAIPDLETDPGHLLQQGLKRLRVTLLPFGVGILCALISVLYGFAQWWQFALLASYTAGGLTLFYLLLRSGVAARWRDPMLTFPQVLFGIGLVALSYAVMDVARAVALGWLCLIIVFDMRRLPIRQTYIAAALAMLLPALGVILAWYLNPGRIKLGNELFFLGLGCGTVPALLMVSAAARRLRGRRKKQREQMTAVLGQLHQLAVNDGLTGLFNRRHMQELLEEELRRYQRTGRPFCVALLDIDFFKRVNDQRGHAMGDTVLRYFSAIGRAAFHGRSDALARWGGEEFLLLMPETTQAQGHAALLRMQAMVRGYDWTQHDASLRITFSAGICEHCEDLSLAQILEAADAALYRAKEAGRDRIETSEPLAEAQQADTAGTAEEVQVLLARAPDFLAQSPAALPEQGGGNSEEHTRPARRPQQGGARPASRWTKWLLGPDPLQHEAIRLCLVASAIYASAFVAVALYAIPTGLISRSVGQFFLITEAIGALVPYLLVRSGVTADWQDRPLVVPQMIWALLLQAVTLVVLPVSLAFTLQVFCTVLVFGFVDLRPRQAMAVGGAAVCILATAFVVLLVRTPAEFVPLREGMVMTVSAFILTLLTLQSHNFALAREQSWQEKRALAGATEKVRDLIIHDALTGLFNRQHMQNTLERECERHERSGHSFCVALIDLDHFKRVNDTLGHHVGDEALKGFAMAAQKRLRETDVIGRWGGEEFLVILTDTEPDHQGLRAVERLREYVVSQRLCASAPEQVVTFSAGVAVRCSGETVAKLLERADQALYAAKQAGRNRCLLG